MYQCFVVTLPLQGFNFMCVKVTMSCRLLSVYVYVCVCVCVCVFVCVLCVMPMMDFQASSIDLCRCFVCVSV